MRKDRGFSLFDAIATLAVFSVGLTVGVPALHGALERQRVHSAMNLLGTDLAMARGTAVMKRQQVVVCPGDMDGCRETRDWEHGWVVFVDADQNRRIDQHSDLLRIESPLETAGSGMAMPSTREYVRYQADGRSANTNLTIRICAKGMLLGQVLVNNLGRVRTERPAAPSACEPA